MNRLSIASTLALVATIFLGLSFLIMPLLNAPVLIDDALSLDADGVVNRENITALSLALDNVPEFEYSLPTVNLLAVAVILAVIAMAAVFIPAVTRTARYVLMVAGILAVLGHFAVPLQTIETDVTNYSQMLGYGFWIGVLASFVLMVQGVIGRESDAITRTVSDFFKSFRVTRNQLLSGILVIIGVVTLYAGVTGFQPEDITADDGSAIVGETITTTLNFAPHGFRTTMIREQATGDTFTYDLELEEAVASGITLSSQDFNALVTVIDPTGEEIASNDDGFDECCDAYLEFTSNMAGTYTVLVSASDGDSSGSGNFRLTIEDLAPDPIRLIVPTGQFIVISGIYFLAVGALGIANLGVLKRVMPILLVLAGVMIFLVLLVGSAAGGSTNATTMLTESLRTATPIAIGAMAGIWCERSGVINIAIEGMMLFGAAIGFTCFFLLQVWYPTTDQNVIYLYMFLSVMVAVLSGGLVSLLHAWLSITFATDQIVSGTVINILALGSTSYIRAEVLLSSEAGLNRLPIIEIPILSQLPVVGPIFASQPIFYLMFVVIILTHVVLYHTRWGLRTIAVGENPHAADTLGIKVNRIRWINVFIGGMIAGLAGAWFSLEATGRFTDSMTDGKGFISLAAMIFGKWTPSGSFGGSLLFGFSEALGFRFQIENVALPPQFLQMVPYIVTLIVLAGLVGRAIPPKAVGQPYKTEGSR
ncbi:MAG: ABC transporter permease [Chloroflexota bacterium]